MLNLFKRASAKDSWAPLELVSVHIPKTAGTSFRKILKREYGQREVIRLDIPLGGKVTRVNEKFYEEDRLPARTKVVHGHFNPVRLRERFPETRQHPVITWVRDPVARTISNYYYFKKQLRSIIDEEGRGLHMLNMMQRTLLEYARDEKNQNRQHKFLAGLDLEDYAFVGVQEYYAEDLSELCRRFGWKDDTVVKVNVTGGKRPEISAEVKEEIARLNPLDMALYQRALDLRQRRLQPAHVDLISIHIPKTAGTSFHRNLKDAYGNSVSPAYRRVDIQKALQRYGQLENGLNGEVSVLHGHFEYGEVAGIHQKFGAKIVCWVRDPIERVISNYNFWHARLNKPPHYNTEVFKQNKHRLNETLETYIERPDTQNLMSRHLASLPLEDTFFIGRTEHYEADLHALATLLGWPSPEAARLNTRTQHKIDAPEVSPATRARIAELNARDIDLYQHALALIERRRGATA